ncbi:TIGR02206 family membrane protein [Jeotgalibacillus salarius]|uniref:TIGR02206 family membrane protein n=1 Tax=Jeotgalibacillus salarius TaxID=546023 RepID=A0A4Y8LHP5_9BACL|nr:TIGR02206 family membrane protein [Jeotgalibacillus salarius]TFE02322.1 TIGR02206 family membrane protein [Jeotgalibacillus salarius]
MFSGEVQERFILFSTEHIVMLALFVLLTIAGLWLFLRTGFVKNATFWTWLFAGIFIISELSYQIWAISVGIWQAANYLPLQLCSFSTFFGLFLLFKPNRPIFYFYFYIAIFPPVFALLTPDLAFAFPHYFYWKFFIQHMAIPLSAVFLLRRDGYTLPKSSIVYALMLLNFCALGIWAANTATGGNYFFLNGPPASDTVLSIFGDGVLYIIGLELTALVVFIVTWWLGKKMVPRTTVKRIEN